MTDIEKDDYSEMLDHWRDTAKEKGAIPVFMMAVTPPELVWVWKGKGFTNNQVRSILEWVLKRTPSNDEIFEYTPPGEDPSRRS